MVLPQPDSPTRPKASPVATLKQTPSTARTVVVTGRGKPFVWVKCFLRPSTFADHWRELRVGRVAQPVAEHVEAEHQHQDREAGKDRQPGRVENVLEALADHAAPGRRRRPYAQAEKAERGLGADRGRQPQASPSRARRRQCWAGCGRNDARVEKPSARPASMKSRSLSARVGARAMRANGAIAVSAMAR